MKYYLLSIAAAFMVFAASAQDNPTSGNGIALGIKAGVNFATLSNDPSNNVKARVGFHAGGFVEIPIFDKFSIQPEILYSAQGDKSGSPSSKTNLDYLIIPVMAKYYIKEGFSLEVGPQGGFLLSAKDKGDGYNEDIKDAVESTDFGVNFGVGYKMETGLSFNVRYNLGLSHVDKYDGPTINNRVFLISIGYNFLN